MQTAMDFLIWEMNVTNNLQKDILDKLHNKQKTFHTNTTEIKINYKKHTVELYNVSQTANNYLQTVNLEVLLQKISKI